MCLPRDLGLDYSIERYGFDIAWAIFWMKLDEFGCNRYAISECTRWRVRAMFLNGDRRGYLVALMDARALTEAQAMRFLGREVVDLRTIIHDEPLKQSVISKWVPGEHYYALDRKFDTYAEAEAYLAEHGYRVLGLRERHAYRGSE